MSVLLFEALTVFYYVCSSFVSSLFFLRSITEFLRFFFAFQLQYLLSHFSFLSVRNFLNSSIDAALAACFKQVLSSSNNISCSSISRLVFTFLTASCTRLTKLSAKSSVLSFYPAFTYFKNFTRKYSQ